MNMNASESGLFKVLMWTITTLMGLVTLGVATILQVVVTIKIDFDKHAVAQDKQENYYVNRLYNDSININTLFVSINELNQILRLHAPEEYNEPNITIIPIMLVIQLSISLFFIIHIFKLS